MTFIPRKRAAKGVVTKRVLRTFTGKAAPCCNKHALYKDDLCYWCFQFRKLRVPPKTRLFPNVTTCRRGAGHPPPHLPNQEVGDDPAA